MKINIEDARLLETYFMIFEIVLFLGGFAKKYIHVYFIAITNG